MFRGEAFSHLELAVGYHGVDSIQSQFGAEFGEIRKKMPPGDPPKYLLYRPSSDPKPPSKRIVSNAILVMKASSLHYLARRHFRGMLPRTSWFRAMPDLVAMILKACAPDHVIRQII